MTILLRAPGQGKIKVEVLRSGRNSHDNNNSNQLLQECITLHSPLEEAGEAILTIGSELPPPPLPEVFLCTDIQASELCTASMSGELLLLRDGEGVEAMCIEMAGLRQLPGVPLPDSRRWEPSGSAYRTLMRWPEWGGNSAPLSWLMAAAAASGVE